MPDPASLVAAILLVALFVYTVTGGADFGGGVWDLFARGPRAAAQRKLIARAMGPIWEANHVWLILVIVLMFVCFPKAFAAVSVALHIPLTILLIGIMMRGTAFVFRSYDSQRDDIQQNWSLLFAVASVVSPVMLGVCLAAVASGSLRVDEEGEVISGFFSSWATPFALCIGAFTLVLFCLLGAVFLTLETDDPELQDDFRLRALGSAVLTAVLAYGSLALAKTAAPPVWHALAESTWALGFQGLAALLGGSLVFALWSRRYDAARALCVALVAVVELGWAVGHWPYVIPPDLTIQATAAPRSVLVPVLWALVGGSVFLVPAFVYLYVVFKGARLHGGEVDESG